MIIVKNRGNKINIIHRDKTYKIHDGGRRGLPGEQGPQGPSGGPLIAGGVAGQVMTKIDSTDYNVEWDYVSKADVGLGNVDNTSDASKPISTATQAALDAKIGEVMPGLSKIDDTILPSNSPQYTSPMRGWNTAVANLGQPLATAKLMLLGDSLAELGSFQAIQQTMARLYNQRTPDGLSNGAYSYNPVYSGFAWSMGARLVVTASGGTMTLTFGSQTTSSLIHNVSAANMKTALDALSSIGGAGKTSTVTLASAGVYDITITGGFFSTNAGTMTVNTGSLTGGSASVNGVTQVLKRGFAGFAAQMQEGTTASTSIYCDSFNFYYMAPPSGSPATFTITVDGVLATTIDTTTLKASRTVTDGVLNSTKTLTSATAAFTAADVGVLVTGTGIPDGTIIQTYTNATTVVLSQTTVDSGSGRTVVFGPQRSSYYWNPGFSNTFAYHAIVITCTSGTVLVDGAMPYVGVNWFAGTQFMIAGHSGWRTVDYNNNPDSLTAIRQESPNGVILETIINDFGRIRTDAVFNGTTTMTSASASFTTADVGTVVTSDGNLPANTRIITRNSATSVTLSAAATTSATGQTIWIGGPDDYKYQMQKLITSVQSIVPLATVFLTIPHESAGHAPLAPFADAVRELARDNNCAIFDNYEVLGSVANGDPYGYTSDGVHLTTLGGKTMVNNMLNVLITPTATNFTPKPSNGAGGATASWESSISFGDPAVLQYRLSPIDLSGSFIGARQLSVTNPSTSTFLPLGVGYPNHANHAVSLSASGSREPVRLATQAALAAHTLTAAVGVTGNILTANANGIMANIDGVSPANGDRILVRNEASGNGIYVVTSRGTASTPFVLTAPIAGDTGPLGTRVSVTAGTVGAGRQYYVSASNVWSIVAIGTGDALVANPLSQFASTTSLQLKNTISDETGSGALVFANSPSLVTPTGIVKGDVGLGNVDNTSDASKPVSTATQTALDLKVTGPASATDNAVVRYDSTTGKLVQNSAVTISDNGFIDANFGAFGQIAYTSFFGIPQIYLFNDGGDANPSTIVGGNGAITAGPGGGSGQDVTLNRSGAGIWTIGANVMRSSTAPSNADDFVNKTYSDLKVLGVASSVDSEVMLYSGTGGKTSKRATGTGIALLTSGVLSTVSTTGSGNVVLSTSPVITTPTGIVKGDVGLGNVDNTSDASKPVSTATQTALDAKVAGPASAVDNAIARFDLTTGKIIQSSSATITDAGVLSVNMGTAGQIDFSTAFGLPQVFMFNDAGDAQPSTLFGANGSFQGGAGGGAGLDVSMGRGSAGVWTLGANKMQSSTAPTTGNDFVNKTYADSGSQTMTNKTLTTPIISSISNTGTLTLPTSTDTLVGRATTDTLTNKRITSRITTITSSATPTVNTDNCDVVTITALAANITSMTSGLSGAPSNFDKLRYRIKDDGTPRTISWGSSFEANGVALPGTTTASKRLTVLFEYDSVTLKWGCLAVNVEA